MSLTKLSVLASMQDIPRRSVNRRCSGPGPFAVKEGFTTEAASLWLRNWVSVELFWERYCCVSKLPTRPCRVTLAKASFQRPAWQ